jgi:glycosyltransferase involved in cell wall biosynthesis
VGDGPLRPLMESMTDEHGVREGVRFHGWVEHRAVQGLMQHCHAMALPSVREFGGGVVLEAMAMGVAPLVVDYAGPGELVDSTVGYKIALGDKAHIVSGLQQTFEQMLAEPEALAQRAARARARAMAHYTWQAKAEQIVQSYRWVCGQRADKPAFAFNDTAPRLG